MTKIDARDNEQTQVENESPESNNPGVDIKGFRSLQGKGICKKMKLIYLHFCSKGKKIVKNLFLIFVR